MTIAAKVNNSAGFALAVCLCFILFLCPILPHYPHPSTDIIIYCTLDDNVKEKKLDGNSVVKDYLATDFVFVY